MLITMVCPQCGGQMQIENNQDHIFCPYCGTRIENVAQRVEVSGTVHHVMDHTGEPNLIISYGSTHRDVVLVTRIVETGEKNTMVSGQRMSYHLSQGRHQIVLKIGNINYNRTIYIPRDNSPVRIVCSYNGRASISIDQPSGTPAEAAAVQEAMRVKTMSALAIVAFVLSLSYYGSPVGAALGIVDLVRKDEDHTHGLAIAAIVIGALVTITLISEKVGT